jgi:hypothetical protein
VAAAADRDHQLLLAGEAESRDHVVHSGRPHDERRTAVDHAVPDGPRLVVSVVLRKDDLAGERLAERAQSLQDARA